MHRTRCAVACTAMVLGLAASAGAWADTVDARCDIYPRGSDRASTVVPCTFSQRQGHITITLDGGVRHELHPGKNIGWLIDDSGKPVYRQRGIGRRGMIFKFERETIYVYWDRSGLPGTVAQSASAPLGAAIAVHLKPPTLDRPFDRTLTLQGIRFRVRCANNAPVNRLQITPSGLAVDNAPIVRDIDGVVIGAEVADLNADGSPEIYVYTVSSGVHANGSLVAFSANRRQSLSEIALPAIAERPDAVEGYQGHDRYAVVERSLVRRFPVYRAGDAPARPSGGLRQLQYRLVPGEATWQLVLDRVVNL